MLLRMLLDDDKHELNRALIAALKLTGHYTGEDVALFQKEVCVRNVSKGELLLTSGNISKSVFYLLEGQAYQYSADNVKTIIDLHLEGEWFFNQWSLIAQKPSDVEIEAYTTCTLLELSLESIHYLMRKSAAFFQLNKIMEQAKHRLHFYDNNLSPLQQYQFIIENRPALIQKFPLHMIASYLKMAPETLSRSREKLFRSVS